MAKYPVDFASRLAQAIAASSRFLAKENAEQGPAWRELLSIERAWPLSVLLAFWYLLQTGREPGYRTAIRNLAEESLANPPAADFFGVWRYFDAYKSLLSRPAQLAYEAKTLRDLATAGGAFKYAAQQIGAVSLAAALKSPLFASIGERLRQTIPVPALVLSAMEAGTQSRDRATVLAAGEPAGASLVAAPALSEHDRCLLLLVSLGHSQQEAEQICQGPPPKADRHLGSGRGNKA